MKKTSRWIIGRGVLLIVTAAVLTACGGDQPTPPPVAPTSTPLPPPPTEAPTSTPLPTPSDTPQLIPTEAPTSTPPPPTDTPQAVRTEAPATSAPATEAVEKPPTELAEAANRIYTQGSCVACHGVNHEGGLGSILVGLPAEYIQAVTRSGEPEAGMPAFDQNAISDDDLSTLAEYLSDLTLQDIVVELSPAVVDHLSQALDALQAGDKAAVETHLEKAQEAGADASPGVQATLKGLVGGLGEADWMKATEVHLEVLLAQ
jgi:mono/diheme cytochrome c family protein